MTQVITQAALTSRTMMVEHIRISSGLPFAEVRRKLEAALPPRNPDIVAALRDGDKDRVSDFEANGPAFVIEQVLDHGALLQIAGRKRDALQYAIGNPITATKMTRHQLSVALYAPLRVALFEDEQGRGVFEYDKPSSVFGQSGDERVTAVGRYLDAAIESVLRDAAE
jgi:uncharacterized protein (DUF302 family)